MKLKKPPSRISSTPPPFSSSRQLLDLHGRRRSLDQADFALEPRGSPPGTLYNVTVSSSRSSTGRRLLPGSLARDVASSQEKLEDVELFPSLPPPTLPSPVHFTYRSFTLCLSLGGGVV